MPFPANRTTAALNELYTNTYEEYDPKIIDLTARSSPMLYASQPDWLNFYRVKPLGHHVIGAVMDTLEEEATPWDGESSTPVNASRVARGNYWAPSNYFKGAGITWREVMESRVPYELLDILDQRVYVAFKRTVETLGKDIWRGSTNNALRILGYHQALFPWDQQATGFLALAKWQFRQANNTYADVARVPFTAEDVGGTNWENLSANMGTTTSSLTGLGFANTTSGPNDNFKAFDLFYELCAEGLDYPDLIVMTRRPYTDYKAAVQGYLRYGRTDTESRGINFAIDNVMYHQAVIIVDDNARYTQATGSVVIATEGAENIHFFNTGDGEYMEIAADPAANIAMSDFYSDSDTPLNSKCLVVTRIRNRVMGPHRCGVLFGYGTAA